MSLLRTFTLVACSLAIASGSPIVPLFAVKMPNGKVRIIVEPPIHVDASADPAAATDAALNQLARIYERYVRTYPDQWFVMQRAWCEEQDPTDLNPRAPQT